MHQPPLLRVHLASAPVAGARVSETRVITVIETVRSTGTNVSWPVI